MRPSACLRQELRPAHRYAELSVEVREISSRYGLSYNTGPLHRQFGSVVKKIVRLGLPPRQWLRRQLGSVAGKIVQPALPLLPGRGASTPDGEEAAVQTRPRDLAAVA
jgi:hypothetical protein